MLFASEHVRVTAEYGVASLWLAFPGDPVNALDAPRLGELDAALAAVERNPFLHALVVRSAKPFGFCAGLHPDVATVPDRAAFAWHGQRTLARLAAVPLVTVAFIDGPCLGVGLELVLACDHRLCVATPRTHLGFPQRFTCFGGSGYLRKRLGRKGAAVVASGRTLSGREARDRGIVDRAFCVRRAKIELRTFLDEIECAPRVPRRTRDETGWVAERRAFAHADLTARALPTEPRTDDVNGLLARGFITPLEAEQMRATARCGGGTRRTPPAGPRDMDDAPPKLPPARDRIEPINTTLAALYPEFEGLNYASPLQLLIAVILSAQCTDKRINQLTPALFARFPTVNDFATCEITELERTHQAERLLQEQGEERSRLLRTDAGPLRRRSARHARRPGNAPRRRPQDRECGSRPRLRHAGHHRGYARRPVVAPPGPDPPPRPGESGNWR